MLEAGIGRAHNIALATLPNFVLPGDVSASKRYWARDIIQPPVETTPHGTIEIRDEPGFGYALDHDYIRAHHGPRGVHRLKPRYGLYALISSDGARLVRQLHRGQDRAARISRRCC